MLAYFHMHPPKTGGTSIITALIDKSSSFREKWGYLYKRANYDHISPLNVPNIGDTVTLGVRNPYNRVLSLVSWINKNRVYTKTFNVSGHLSEKSRYKKVPVDVMMSKDLVHRNYRWATQACMHDWEKSVPDCEVKIFRFENLVEDFNSLYSNISLPHVHNTQPFTFNHVQENFHCQEVLSKFNNEYAVDFEKYCYTIIEHIDDFYQEYQTFS